MPRPWNIAVGLVLALLVTDAEAQGWVSFLHTPPEVQPEGVSLVLEGSLIGVGAMERMDVRFRRIGSSEWQSATVLPATGDLYRATVPAGQVRAPGIEYYLVLVTSSGSERSVFASASAPRRVRVDPAGTAREPTRDPIPPTTPEAGPSRTEEPGGSEAEGPPEPGSPPLPTPDSADPFAAEQAVFLAGARPRSVSEAPAVMSVVSSAQIRAMGARTLADVLKSVPGLETSRDVQGFHQVAVRGIRSDPEVLLLYDGRRLDSLYDGRKLYEMPVENVDRVEILRGPGATLHGTGAFLAVINVVPAERDGLFAAGSVDTSGLASVHAAYGRPLGAGRFRVEGDLDAGRGYQAPIATDVFHKDTKTPAGMTDDSRLLLHLGGSASQDIGDGELSLTIRGLHQDRAALVGAFDSVGAGSNLRWTVMLGGARYRTEVGGFDLSLGLGGDLQWASRRFHLTPNDFRSTDGHVFPEGAIEETSHSTGGVLFDASAHSELFEGNLLSFGLMAGWQTLGDWRYAVNHDPGTGQPLDQPATPADVVFPAHDPGLTNRLLLAIHALDEWRMADWLELTAGFRGDLFLGGVGRDDPAAPVGERGMEFALSPRFGAVFTPAKDWKIKALHATAFRVPTFEELTSRLIRGTVVRGRYQGNPTLSAVRIRTTELAVDHSFSLSDRVFALRANAFLNEFQGRIEAVDLTGNVTPLFNRDGVIRVIGAEGEGRMSFTSRDWISLGMAWFRAVDSQAPEGRNLLTTVPQLRLILRSQLGLGRHLDLHIGAVFGAERRNNARSSLEALRRYSIPAYALVDTTIQTRPIAEKLCFALTIQNLLDNPYQDDVPRPDRISGLLPGPGITARLSARLVW